jgi:UDP-N-acetylmuramyl pentapeptide phosphotransferase/UDP-N-acetylglucosamine-1-phosphate transferase
MMGIMPLPPHLPGLSFSNPVQVLSYQTVRLTMPTLLQISFELAHFKVAVLSFVTAFVAAMLVMPVLIRVIRKFKLYDVPDDRKEHAAPVPTMGGVAVCVGMGVACVLWYRFSGGLFEIAFFFSAVVLFVLGVLDDLHNIPARNKLVLQVAVGSLIAFSGVRITDLNGLFGIDAIPLAAQYTLTVLIIAGITNAFNLIDGIDGLAGGLGFMSLLMLGLFLTVCNDANTALIAFSLAGGLLGFLYYNFNPARIFMGDTGSLVLGFVVSVLCIRFLSVNTLVPHSFIPHAPVFALGIVLIPVFDTMRVLSLRTWQGKSPFAPDKTHIHHLLTANGWTHSFTSKIICTVHGGILVLAYFLKGVSQEWGLLILLTCMLLVVWIFKRIRLPNRRVLPAEG